MKNFTFYIETQKSPHEVYDLLTDIPSWWSGQFGETIDGKSSQLNDEFTFKAGEGMHYSKQKLVELEKNKKLVWLVTDSELTFLQHSDEWTGTKLSFDIAAHDGKTKITFTHEGLYPTSECYNECSSGWTQYLEAFKKKLN